MHLRGFLLVIGESAHLALPGNKATYVKNTVWRPAPATDTTAEKGTVRLVFVNLLPHLSSAFVGV